MLTTLLLTLAMAVAPQSPVGQPPEAPQAAQITVTKVKPTHIGAGQAYKQVRDAKIAGIEYLATDPTDDSLVFKATASATQAILDLIAKIDVAPIVVRKFKLRNVGAKDVVDKLRKPIKGVDYISSDPTDDSVVARGTPSGLDELAKRIAEIDKAAVEVRKLKLRHADAFSLVKKLRVPIPGVDYISSDPTDNSIVARGTPRGLEELAKRIEALDRP